MGTQQEGLQVLLPQNPAPERPTGQDSSRRFNRRIYRYLFKYIFSKSGFGGLGKVQEVKLIIF